MTRPSDPNHDHLDAAERLCRAEHAVAICSAFTVAGVQPVAHDLSLEQFLGVMLQQSRGDWWEMHIHSVANLTAARAAADERVDAARAARRNRTGASSEIVGCSVAYFDLDSRDIASWRLAMAGSWDGAGLGRIDTDMAPPNVWHRCTFDGVDHLGGLGAIRTAQ